MVFSFTFFIYNGQRLYRIKQKTIHQKNHNERIKWVVHHKKTLTVLSLLFALIGLLCTLFINPYCFFILIPMGALSVFYVVPILKTNLSLRTIPYLKVFVIGITWSATIVLLPMVDSEAIFKTSFGVVLLSFSQVFLFVIAITLPFDVRDFKWDERNHLKTIPHLIGIKKTIICAKIILVASILLTCFLPIGIYTAWLILGQVITLLIITFTHEKRTELFYAGLIEGTVLILYGACLFRFYFF